MDWDDYERFDFCRESLYQATKEYLCCECGRTIPKGIKYWYTFGISKRDTYIYRMCSACRKDWKEIISIFYDNNYDIAFIYTLLSEAFNEAVEEEFLERDDPLVVEWLKRRVNPDQLELELFQNLPK